MDDRPMDDREAVGGIDVRVPLDAEHASLLRVTVASVAADHGFTVDEIDDLRLAVSEVFAALAGVPGPDRCVMQLALEPDGLVVTLGLEPTSAVPVLDGLASTILSSVVDECRVSDDQFVLVKRAVESAAAH